MEANRLLWIAESARGRVPNPPPANWTVRHTAPDEALRDLTISDHDAIVLDFPLAGWSAPELWEELQRLAPEVPVLIRDPRASLHEAVRMGRLGVYQILTETEDPFHLIEQAVESRRSGNLARLSGRVNREDWERLLLGESREMRQVSHIIRMVGNRRATVLITGETGTGKEIAARAFHLAGSRRSGQMVAVNCSALPENLLESRVVRPRPRCFHGGGSKSDRALRAGSGRDPISG